MELELSMRRLVFMAVIGLGGATIFSQPRRLASPSSDLEGRFA